MRESLRHFTNNVRGLSLEETHMAVGSAIQELTANIDELIDTQKESAKRTEELHKERVELANQRHFELVTLINSRVDRAIGDFDETFRKLDKHIIASAHCQQTHERILEDLQEHVRKDVSIDAWLGKHATAVIKAVLVFIGGAILAYTWKKVTGI